MHLSCQTQKYIHFIGIGGIGMSGIAEVLYNLGYKVKGSDIYENQNTHRLKSLGIPVYIGHKASHVEECLVVVISSAVKPDNPEIIQAKLLGIPVIQRAEMLAELMRLKKSVAISGTHGKTTTTSLMAALFETAGLDPTIVNGGILNSHNTNAKLGEGEWIVVEADESDGSFTKLFPTFSVVTNIDPEHMDFYQTFERLEESFVQFIHNMPFYGMAALCIDHPVVRRLFGTISNRRLVSYGFHEEAMIRAVNIKPTQQGVTFDVDIVPHPLYSKMNNVCTLPRRIYDLYLPIMGMHNVQNALSVVAIAQELNISDDILRQAFEKFKGVKRRFTQVGVSHGITIIDDYAHHPVEIETVLKAAIQACPNGNIIAVVQPHRYSRLKDLFPDFVNVLKKCAKVIVAPVYSAGEEPEEGINAIELAKAIRQAGCKEVYDLLDPKELPYLIRRLAVSGDYVLCMGAGSITYWASLLPSQLDNLCPIDNNDQTSSLQTNMKG